MVFQERSSADESGERSGRAKNRVIDPIDYYDEKLLPYFYALRNNTALLLKNRRYVSVRVKTI